MPDDASRPLVLLTGATGYVGGRLLRALRDRGERVRCLARRPEHLEPRVDDDTEVVAGDLTKPETLPPALEGVHTAYYLVHALGSGSGFEAEEHRAAKAFAAAARDAGVRRIIYLGGLGRGEDRSPHLRSRHETGRILHESGVPTLELRASIIIGSGSLSFDLVRALTERLPVMLMPSWTRNLAQPVAIEDVLAYLLAGLDADAGVTGVYEIGGPDRTSYSDLLRIYAELRGLRRWMIPVPVLTPALSSLWLGFITPVYARIGRKLVESLVHPTIVEDTSALDDFPVKPMGAREAMERALVNEDRAFAETRWSDAMSSTGALRTWGGVRYGTRLVDTRARRVAVPAATAFGAVRRIGGERGWYFADFLWRLRGALDLLLGGPGMRRGRRDPEHVAPGETLDFWRVEAVEPDRLLRLRAEMKVPGRAWLQFEVEPDGDGSIIRQTAVFDPQGLSGLLYWYGIWPLHAVVFRGMLRGIARAAERAPRTDPAPTR